ncbi:MAG: hypothetical protein IKW49_02745 [Opitutales bacterium]|nr:hypothetical protein [Opitutales bacterium]
MGKPFPPWYKQRRDLENMKSACLCFGDSIPAHFYILPHLSGIGRKTDSLREWLKISAVETRNKDRFVDGLAKLVSCENDLLSVEPFDVEAAKKPLKESGEIQITIFSACYASAIEYREQENDRERNRHKARKCKSVANLQQPCNEVATKMQCESEVLSGKDGKTCAQPVHIEKKRLSPTERESLKEQKNENPYDYL